MAALQLCEGKFAQVACHATLLLRRCRVCTNAEAAAGYACGCRSCQLPRLICVSAVQPAHLKYAADQDMHLHSHMSSHAPLCCSRSPHTSTADCDTHLHRPCAQHAHLGCRCFSLVDRTLSAVLALAASPWVHRGAGLNRLRTNFWQGECLLYGQRVAGAHLSSSALDPGHMT